MTIAIIIFVCAALYAFVDYYKTKKIKDLGFAILLFIGVIATFIQTLNDDEQSDNIEALSRIDTSLSHHLDTLQLLNNKISTNTNELTAQIKHLSDSIKKLNDSIYGTVIGINNVSAKNLRVANEVQTITKNEIAENTLNGEFHFDKILTKKEIITIRAGNLGIGSFSNPIGFMFDSVQIVDLNIINSELMVNAKIFDRDMNLLVEIVNNKWRVNPHFKNKMNYDSKGFEIIDDKDAVVFSINIISETTIDLRGILFNGQNYLILTDNYIVRWDKKTFDNYKMSLPKEIKKIFVYTGKDWLGKRNIYEN